MKQLTKKGIVTDNNGHVAEKGYSFQCIKSFDREKTARPSRIKEWDFYQITGGGYTVQLTIGHVTYAGAVSVNVFSLDGKERYEFPCPLLFPKKKLNLPDNAHKTGKISYESKNYSLIYDIQEDYRTFTFSAISKKYGRVSAEFRLDGNINKNGIMVVTPFYEPFQFYHNYKVNCLIASGKIKIGEKEIVFGDDAFGLLDWGRGILPYTHTWWWGNGSAIIDGKNFGFNIGVFGDTTYATENVIFYDDKAHKLGKISFQKDKIDYLKPWIFTSDDKRFEMTFTPIFDNHTQLFLLVAHNRCHQVFGHFNGTAVLDDGKVIIVKDMLAFCEIAKNRW